MNVVITVVPQCRPVKVLQLTVSLSMDYGYECTVADPEQGLSNYSSLVFTSLKLKLFHVHDIILISYKSQGVELSEKISSDQEIVTIY